jgi:hypothetical protein
MCHLPIASHFVVTAPQQRWPIRLLHHGVANLPGESHVSLHLPDRAPSE